jgi:hypothetical protein
LFISTCGAKLWSEVLVSRALMTDEERKEMLRISSVMQTEQNPAKIAAMLKQLNELFERKEKRLVKKLKDIASQS